MKKTSARIPGFSVDRSFEIECEMNPLSSIPYDILFISFPPTRQEIGKGVLIN